MFLARTPLRSFTRHIRQNIRCLSDKKDNNNSSSSTSNISSSNNNNNDNQQNDKDSSETSKVFDPSRERRLQDWKMIDSSSLQPPPQEDPIRRTHRILKNDILRLKKYIPGWNDKSLKENATMWKHVLMGDQDVYPQEEEIFPSHCDVVIIGGGAIGSSIAYYLKEGARDGLRIVVLEKDKTYEKASTTLSVGGLRQQFSLEENILMGLYASDFLRMAKYHLGDHVNVNFVPHGYLFLATEQGAEQLERNSILQNRLGAKNVILSRKKLKQRFPCLNVDDIALGCYGLEREGWFDPWSLLMGFKHKAQHLGVDYVDGEAVNFEFKQNDDICVQGVPQGEYQSTNHVIVKLKTGEVKRITFATCIIAAGAWSGQLARLLRIGAGKGILSVPLPVEPRKRYVYTIKSQGENQPLFNMPLTIDPKSSTYFRCDGLGGNFLCGRSPDIEDEPPIDNLDVDYNYFDEMVWPHLAHRVPAFENAKVCSAWSGYYEFNTFDENGIIGLHPYYHNIFFATGFSGHGIQQAPAVGRAISELILNGEYTTLDLSRLGFDRLMVAERMLEQNIV